MGNETIQDRSFFNKKQKNKEKTGEKNLRKKQKKTEKTGGKKLEKNRKLQEIQKQDFD